MEELISMMICVQILADDLHYRSHNLNFYANHLLADRVKDGLDSDIDALKESYWLGELKGVPPHDERFMEKGIELAKAIRGQAFTEGNESNSFGLMFCVRDAADKIIHKIEEMKRTEEFMSGTVALLDGISQKMLVAYGLIDRSVIAG